MSEPLFDNVCVIRKLNNPNSDGVNSVVSDIEYWCTKHSIPIIETKEINFRTLVVAIGGDGTVIQAAKIAAPLRAYVLGFNLGKVGFLADFKPADVIDTLEAAHKGWLKCEQRTMLDAQFGEHKMSALNDIVVSCMMSDTSFSYDLGINDSFAGSHKANGVIVSTATGSTAYALNVGGAILMPTLDVMQVTPIAAQTLTSRPLIVGGNLYNTISVKFGVDPNIPMTIRADGQIVVTTCHDPNSTNGPIQHSRLVITISPHFVNLLHHHSWNHFDILNQKLGWV